MPENTSLAVDKPSDEDEMLCQLESARRHEGLRPIAYAAALLAVFPMLRPALELMDRFGDGPKAETVIVGVVFGASVLVFRGVNEVLRRLTLRKPRSATARDA